MTPHRAVGNSHTPGGPSRTILAEAMLVPRAPACAHPPHMTKHSTPPGAPTVPTPPSPDPFTHSEALARLLAPRHEPGVPYHVYTLRDSGYDVRPYQADEPFPAFWWTMRGRVLVARLLPPSVQGLHAIITYFQFNAARDEVFQTVHLSDTGTTVKAVAADAGVARAQHQQVFDAVLASLPPSNDDLPDWL